MEALLAVVIGILYGVSLFLILDGNLIRIIVGFSILSNAANLLVFTSGRMTRATPPLIPQGMESLPGPFANPLPEALILTAIVIGFGMLAFAIVLVYRAQLEFGSVNSEEIDIEGEELFR